MRSTRAARSSAISPCDRFTRARSRVCALLLYAKSTRVWRSQPPVAIELAVPVCVIAATGRVDPIQQRLRMSGPANRSGSDFSTGRGRHAGGSRRRDRRAAEIVREVALCVAFLGVPVVVSAAPVRSVVRCRRQARIAVVARERAPHRAAHVTVGAALARSVAGRDSDDVRICSIAVVVYAFVARCPPPKKTTHPLAAAAVGCRMMDCEAGVVG